MCCKEIVLGFVVGASIGCLVCGMPAVRKTMSEIKFVLEKDIVAPVKEFMSEKSKAIKRNCDCMENEN